MVEHPLDRSFTVFGKRWSGPILLELNSGKHQFSQLIASIPGLGPRTLSLRLREYQELGLIRKEMIQSETTTFHYVWTEKGEEMRNLLRSMVHFSLRWHSQTGLPIRL